MYGYNDDLDIGTNIINDPKKESISSAEFRKGIVELLKEFESLDTEEGFNDEAYIESLKLLEYTYFHERYTKSEIEQSLIAAKREYRCDKICSTFRSIVDRAEALYGIIIAVASISLIDDNDEWIKIGRYFDDLGDPDDYDGPDDLPDPEDTIYFCMKCYNEFYEFDEFRLHKSKGKCVRKLVANDGSLLEPGGDDIVDDPSDYTMIVEI